MEYKALKKGWIPYNEAFQKYVGSGDKGRFISKIPEEYKELIGRVWFVNTEWFEAYKNGELKKIYVIDK